MTSVSPRRPQLSRHGLFIRYVASFLIAAALALCALSAKPTSEEDKKAVAALDVAYQAAVKRNDADAMAKILADDFVLILGKGTTYSKSDLLETARAKKIIYEQQDELQQVVRVWGDTAVVTALLWLKGTNEGKPFDRKLWFSDVYLRTPEGWRYVFGQASLPLPDEPAK